MKTVIVTVAVLLYPALLLESYRAGKRAAFELIRTHLDQGKSALDAMAYEEAVMDSKIPSSYQ